MPLRHWLQLTLTEGIGPILTQRLIKRLAAPSKLAAQMWHCSDPLKEFARYAKSQTIFESLKRAARRSRCELARCESANVTLIDFDSPAYPIMLKAIPDPPPVLYIRGNLESRDLNAVGIVGSRRCSHYGREQAERFGALLAEGVTVVSGGARGVDSAAHRAIAGDQGRTIAVLGCGVDIAYPPENESLFRQIAARGAVISEFPMSAPPARENFPRRNRIISGLSRGVLVVEADVASGALDHRPPGLRRPRPAGFRSPRANRQRHVRRAPCAHPRRRDAGHLFNGHPR